eukprot:366003-Chlamydomonas_euryale.AAC.6
MPALGMPVVASWGTSLSFADGRPSHPARLHDAQHEDANMTTAAAAAARARARTPDAARRATVSTSGARLPTKPSSAAGLAAGGGGGGALGGRVGDDVTTSWPRHVQSRTHMCTADGDAIFAGDGASSAATSRGSPVGSLELPSSELSCKSAAADAATAAARARTHARLSAAGASAATANSAAGGGSGGGGGGEGREWALQRRSVGGARGNDGGDAAWRGGGGGCLRRRKPSRTQLRREDVLEMANMDCTDASCDVWCSLPTGGMSPGAVAATGASADSADPGFDHGIDVFAY